MDIHQIAWKWLLLCIHSCLVSGDVVFLERHVGESVVLPCAYEETDPSPIGVTLKRKWLHVEDVMFVYTEMSPTVFSSDNDKRIRVTGDPSTYQVNVSISHLTAMDTDRYECEFVIPKYPLDEKIAGKTEFYLHVAESDVPGSVTVGHIEACAGGSAVLPCLAPHGEGSAMEGVTLKRRRGRGPVEVLYHSKQQHHSHRSASPSPSSSSSHSSGLSSPGRLVLSTVLHGMAYNLTLLQLQPEDSAFYSCHLLLPGRPDSSSSLGRHVFYLSVQGGPCGCNSYVLLLYAMSSAVGLLLIFLIGVVVIYRSKARDRVKPQAPAPIYEEMVGVKPPNRKLSSCHLGPLHLEETGVSVYSNSPAKSRIENPYEGCHGALLSNEQDVKYE